jgi:phytoene dehydrogenase-like protein
MTATATPPPRPVVIGGGHNGLTAAFYMARAGLQPLVLEARDVVGGAAVTESIAPGFRCPLAHATGPLRASVVRDMSLTARVEFVTPDPRLVAVSRDGRALTFSPSVERTVEAIRRFSEADAAKYPEFSAGTGRLSAFLDGLMTMTPPSLDEPAAGELWDLLKVGRRFRALGRRDGFRLLRWMPMAVADLVAEFFSMDLLQAAVAARGVFGTAQGPWSAGTGAVLLLNAAADPAPGGSSVTVKGGTGALTAAMADAARETGAEIRTGVPVERVIVRGNRAVAVALADGTEIAASAVVASTDPRRTFLQLVDPVDLDPGFLTKVRNYRAVGTVSKVDFALGALPAFRGVANAADLRGRIQIGDSIDYIERAFDASKYGEISPEPYLDIMFPSLHDSALAPQGRHVMSVYVQYTPYKLAGGAPWPAAEDSLAKTVLKTIEAYAPGISALVEARRVVSPHTLETVYGLTGGHILHGEPSLDQVFTMRPVLNWAQYRSPIDGLFMCGSGTHPGGGLTAASGQNAAREIIAALKRARSAAH